MMHAVVMSPTMLALACVVFAPARTPQAISTKLD